MKIARLVWIWYTNDAEKESQGLESHRDASHLTLPYAVALCAYFIYWMFVFKIKEFHNNSSQFFVVDFGFSFIYTTKPDHLLS